MQFNLQSSSGQTRPEINMADMGGSTRLRNACDACHKLKRRCTGTKPCENCASLGTSCFYSAAGRLGRPRGSKSRRNADNEKTNRTQTSETNATKNQDNSSTDTSTLNNDMFPDFDCFDPSTTQDIFSDLIQSPGADLNLFPNSCAESVGNLGNQTTFDTMSQMPSATRADSPLSVFSQTMQLDQQHDLHTQPGFFPPPTSSQPQQQLPTLTYPKCQCIPGLSSLLHELEHAGDIKTSATGVDTVLARVSNALAQWSSFAECSRCQSHDGGDEDGATLLLGVLCMRRVVAQVIAMSSWLGSQECNEATGNDIGPHLQVGSYQITGSDRTFLLSVLQTITVRKLDSVVTTMQSMLRARQARRGDSDAAMLNHIKTMLDELAKSIRSK